MPLIHIKTARVEYKFEIHGKYTIIKGNSGTGKTTLYDLAASLTNHSKAVQNISGVNIVAVPVYFEAFRFEDYSDCVMIIDESCSIFKRHDVASIFQKSKNYFIIINRSMKLGYLPIHVDNVFQIKTSGKFHSLEKIYQRFEITDLKKIDVIITEDNKSGYLFFKDLLSIFDLEKRKILLEPAYGGLEDRKISNNHAGASKIVKSIEYHVNNGCKDILVVYDSSAFAAYVDLLIEAIHKFNKVHIYVLDWDSFEGYILASSVYDIHISLEDLDHSYESLEQCFTDKIKEILTGYSKEHLHWCLRRVRCNPCSHAAGCFYRRFSYADLVYSEVELIYQCIKNNSGLKN